MAGQAHRKDLPILDAAVASGCEWLVTFNVRHFRPKGTGIRVTQPGTFIGELRGRLEGLAEG